MGRLENDMNDRGVYNYHLDFGIFVIDFYILHTGVQWVIKISLDENDNKIFFVCNDDNLLNCRWLSEYFDTSDSKTIDDCTPSGAFAITAAAFEEDDEDASDDKEDWWLGVYVIVIVGCLLIAIGNIIFWLHLKAKSADCIQMVEEKKMSTADV